MFQNLIKFIRAQYGTNDLISLHVPTFKFRERQYVLDAIDSTFVSSVGAFVTRFESEISAYTSSPHAIATVNGTAALHIALQLVGVKKGDLVITQPLTFVATCNSINYCGAEPVFIDVDTQTLGLSPLAMEDWLDNHAYLDADGICRSITSQKIIRACLPMHTFGHPVELDGLLRICTKWNISLVEDAAESLGSFYKGRHTGTLGLVGTLSFNGNKIITTGGGGMILTNNYLGVRAKHLTTTAKKPHAYEFYHDEVGYNYRLPNLNAALGCAQLEQIESFIANKRLLASKYKDFFQGTELQFFTEPPDCRSNYWLNSVICEDKQQRDKLLQVTNEAGVMTRPIWTLMNRLPSFSHCSQGNLTNAKWLEERVVNLPSSVCPE